MAQALAPSIDGKRFVPVVEMIINSDPMVTSLIASSEKYRQLEKSLRKGALPACRSQNAVLQELVKKEVVSNKEARAIAYAPEDLEM